MADPYPLIGQTVSHYRSIERLGGGGWEMVCPVPDSTFDCTVAVPFLFAEAQGDQTANKRLVTDAYATAATDYPVTCKGCKRSPVWGLR